MKVSSQLKGAPVVGPHYSNEEVGIGQSLDFFFPTAAAFKSQETICRNSAFDERFEFIDHILWEWTVFHLTRLNEAVQVLVYNLEAGCKFGTTSLVFRVRTVSYSEKFDREFLRFRTEEQNVTRDEFLGMVLLGKVKIKGVASQSK